MAKKFGDLLARVWSLSLILMVVLVLQVVEVIPAQAADVQCPSDYPLPLQPINGRCIITEVEGTLIIEEEIEPEKEGQNVYDWSLFLEHPGATLGQADQIDLRIVDSTMDLTPTSYAQEVRLETEDTLDIQNRSEDAILYVRWRMKEE